VQAHQPKAKDCPSRSRDFAPSLSVPEPTRVISQCKKSGSEQHDVHGWKYINKLEEVEDGVRYVYSFDV